MLYLKEDTGLKNQKKKDFASVLFEIYSYFFTYLPGFLFLESVF